MFSWPVNTTRGGISCYIVSCCIVVVSWAEHSPSAGLASQCAPRLRNAFADSSHDFHKDTENYETMPLVSYNSVVEAIIVMLKDFIRKMSRVMILIELIYAGKVNSFPLLFNNLFVY